MRYVAFSQLDFNIIRGDYYFWIIDSHTGTTVVYDLWNLERNEAVVVPIPVMHIMCRAVKEVPIGL